MSLPILVIPPHTTKWCSTQCPFLDVHCAFTCRLDLQDKDTRGPSERCTPGSYRVSRVKSTVCLARCATRMHPGCHTCLKDKGHPDKHLCKCGSGW